MLWQRCENGLVFARMYKDAALAEIAYNGDFSKLSARSPPKPQNHINNLNDDGKSNKKNPQNSSKTKNSYKINSMK